MKHYSIEAFIRSKSNQVMQAPVVRRLDNASQQINLYPVDSAVRLVNTYSLDRDLSGG